MNAWSPIVISDRRGEMLYSGGDEELSYVACSVGLGMGVFPEMRLTHLIPKERISTEYLLKLYEGTETTDALLAYKWQGSPPNQPFTLRGLLSILKNAILQRGLDRQMYFARLRAQATARRIIMSSQAMKAQMKALS
jgi:hypothetical protein